MSGHSYWQHQVMVAGTAFITLDALVPLAGEEHVEASYALLEVDDNALRLETFGREPRRFGVSG